MTVDRRWILRAIGSSIVASLTRGANADAATQPSIETSEDDRNWNELVGWFTEGLKDGAQTFPDPPYWSDIIDTEKWEASEKAGNVAYATKVKRRGQGIWANPGKQATLKRHAKRLGFLTGTIWRDAGATGNVTEENFGDARDKLGLELCKKTEKACVLCNSSPVPKDQKRKKKKP